MTLAASLTTTAKNPAPPKPSIFDNVAAVLRERYYDKKFREEQLPALIEKYRPARDAA